MPLSTTDRPLAAIGGSDSKPVGDTREFFDRDPVDPDGESKPVPDSRSLDSGGSKPVPDSRSFD